jgi:hypothetical protein
MPGSSLSTSAGILAIPADPEPVGFIAARFGCGIGKGGPDVIVIPVGNEDLAAAVDVTPFTVSRSLRKWQQEGILRKGRNRICGQAPPEWIDSALLPRDESCPRRELPGYPTRYESDASS